MNTTLILTRQEAFQIPDLLCTKINSLPEGIEEVRVVEIQGLDLHTHGGNPCIKIIRNVSDQNRRLQCKGKRKKELPGYS